MPLVILTSCLFGWRLPWLQIPFSKHQGGSYLVLVGVSQKVMHESIKFFISNITIAILN